MDAPMKRPHDTNKEDISNAFSKRCKLHSREKDDSLSIFGKWCDQNNFILTTKVRVGKAGSCAQYGMIAIVDIDEGECLFQIPRQHLLTPDTCSMDSALKHELQCLKSDSGWVPLLVSLMYEFSNPASKWRPYFDLVPDFKELDLPMFWPEPEREDLLQGTGVFEAVQRDIDSITKEFQQFVLPFVNKHREHFQGRCDDIEFYKQMVAFVMAYSFTEPADSDSHSGSTQGNSFSSSSSPMMVPMADILNHVSKNNAHLDFEKTALKMVATKAIRKGEEVYNTYGELANWHLLHMYGFSEEYPSNVFDTVDIAMVTVYEACKTVSGCDRVLLEEKWNFLKELEIVTDSENFIVGMEGILTEEELYNTLKVLVMDRANFEEHREKEGWSDADVADEEEHDEELLSFDAISRLPDTWKELVKKSVVFCLQRYKTSIEDDEKQLKNQKCLSDRNRFALYTNYGQKCLLKRLIKSCS